VSEEKPYVVGWAEIPLDMTSIVGKFQRSQFNAVYTDAAHGLAVGHWEVERGYEDYGSFPQAELFLIVEGQATVEAEGRTMTVGPGDMVLMLPGRQARFVVQEPVRAFYVTVGAEGIEEMQRVRREAVR